MHSAHTLAIVRAAHAATWTPQAIAAMHDLPRACVYRWIADESALADREAREDSERALVARLVEIDESAEGAYGARRARATLADNAIHVSRRRVASLMRADGLVGAHARKRERAPTLYPSNLLLRRFVVARLNRVWVSDATQWLTADGWLYLAATSDLCSRRVVGYALGPTVDTRLTLEALAMGVAARRPGSGLIHHSDRGSPYSSADFRAALVGYGIRASMSESATCLDNAAAESLFSSIKREFAERLRRRFRVSVRLLARDLVARELVEFLGWYNRDRLHSSLGYVSPADYESRPRGERARGPLLRRTRDLRGD